MTDIRDTHLVTSSNVLNIEYLNNVLTDLPHLTCIQNGQIIGPIDTLDCKNEVQSDGDTSCSSSDIIRLPNMKDLDDASTVFI